MDNLPINPVDGIVILAVLLSGVLALIRGLVREVLSLISWFLAIYAGVQGAPLVKPTMLKYTDNELIASAGGGFIVFLVVLILLTIASYFIARSVRAVGLTSIDRSLGFIFGAIRGFLVVSLIYLGGTLIFTDRKEYPNWLTEAKTEPALETSSLWLQAMMPKDLKDDLDISMKNAKDSARQAKETKDNLQRMQNAVPERKTSVEKAAKESVPEKPADAR